VLSHSQVGLARVLMRRRAVADGHRYAATLQVLLNRIGPTS
jgi:hypothetical protein